MAADKRLGMLCEKPGKDKSKKMAAIKNFILINLISKAKRIKFDVWKMN